MKSILCYGDSNTWGYDPASRKRLPADVRWTGVLRRMLSADCFEVIEEGLNGRTTVWDDPIEGHKNGKEYLIPCLESHRPLDLAVIMLGTNDLKKRFSLSALDVSLGAAELVDIVRKGEYGPGEKKSQVLLLAPPPVLEIGEWAEMLEGAAKKSRLLAGHFRRRAEERHCGFLDVSEVAVSSSIDGIHFEPAEHRKLGCAVASRVLEMLRETDSKD